MDNKIEIQHVRLIREKKDEKDRVIYREYSDGYWECYQYDEHGNRTYYRDSYGKSEKANSTHLISSGCFLLSKLPQ